MIRISTGIIIFNLCIFLAVTTSAAQSACDNTQLTLRSQAEVDSYPSQYCNTLCSLIIQGEDITNLDSLSVLTKVGSLTIRFNSMLTDISGLSNITSIEGSCTSTGLYIQSNNLLSDLSGLSSVTRIAGNLDINSNTMLANVDGLANVTELGGSLSVANNATLEDLDGLAGISTIEGYVLIQANPGLGDLNGFRSVTEIEGLLSLGYNDNLTDLDGFSALTRIGEQLMIQANPHLTTISGLSNVGYIGQWLVSGESITISSNEELLSIDGFQNLDTIRGVANIESNNSLRDVNGFSEVQYVGLPDNRQSYNAGINISDNHALTGVTLNSLTVIANGRSTYLRIKGNPELESISVPNLTRIQGALGGDLTIQGNAALKDLDGFGSLESITGGMGALLLIDNNASLENIDGLHSLVRVTNVSSVKITNNTSLGSFCGMHNLIHGKGVGCGAPECYNPSSITISGNERNPTVEQIEEEGPCGASFEQPTNLVFSNVTSQGAKGIFTGGAGYVSGYVVLMKSFGAPAPADVPQDGSTYHVGQVLGSSTIVVSVGADTTFTVTGLMPSIPYYFDVFSYKASAEGNDYLVVNPLEGSQTTTAQTAMMESLVFTNVTNESMTISLGDVDPGNYLALMKAYDYPSPNDVPVDGRQYRVGNVVGSSTIVVNVGDGSEFTVHGLMPGTKYYFDIYRYDASTRVYEAGPRQGNQATEREELGAYPNPFDVATSIPFVVGEESYVNVVIYDMTGREVDVLASGSFGTGRYEARWNGADRNGNRVQPGVYVYSVKSDKGVVTGRVAVR